MYLRDHGSRPCCARCVFAARQACGRSTVSSYFPLSKKGKVVNLAKMQRRIPTCRERDREVAVSPVGITCELEESSECGKTGTHARKQPGPAASATRRSREQYSPLDKALLLGFLGSLIQVTGHRQQCCLMSLGTFPRGMLTAFFHSHRKGGLRTRSLLFFQQVSLATRLPGQMDSVPAGRRL